MRMPVKTALIALIVLPSLGLAFNNFQVFSQSATAVANVGAGVGASLTDPNVAYYNPAAMSYFTAQDASFSFLGIADSTKYKGTITPTPAVAGFNNSGRVQGGHFIPLGSIMYVAPINPNWAFGLSISQPYSMSLHYNRGAFTRYASYSEDFDMVNFGPSISYKPMKDLSFGIGFDAAYTSLGYQLINFAGTTAADSRSKYDASAWGFGFHAGMIWRASDKTNIGLSYRSRMSLRLKGNNTLRAPLGYSKTRFKSEFALPPMTLLSIQQALNKRWTLLGSASFTQFSSMKTFDLDQRGSSQRFNIAKGLEDAWRFALGADFRVNKKVKVTAGAAYNQGPLSTSNSFITFPAGSQYILGFGVTYFINDTFNVTAGYNHTFVSTVHVRNYVQSYGNRSITGNGHVYSNLDTLGIELNWKMT